MQLRGAALQYPWVMFTRWWLGFWGARNAGLGASPMAGKERRNFLLISCLIRLIHLLSLYREVYLTPKQATNKP